MGTISTHKIPTLLTFAQFAKRHPGFSVNTLRWLRVKADPDAPDCNGLAPAFWKVSGRVLVDESKFFQILAEQNGRTCDAD